MKTIYKIIFLLSIVILLCNQLKSQSLPQAEFVATITNFCEDTWVGFDDLSTGAPTSWYWSFNGGIPATSTSKNPIVYYDTVGVYDVQLIVSNQFGYDTIIKTNYITKETKMPTGLSIGVSANPICPGTNVVFNAVPINGGSNPAFFWYLNGNLIVGNSGPTFASSTMANIDQVFCIMISSLTCTTENPVMSDTITMVVGPYLPVDVQIAASDDTICQGTPVTITATPLNGGSNPTYNWMINGIPVNGNITNVLNYNAFNNNDIIVCELTSNSVCVTLNIAFSNSITMVVKPSPVISNTVTSQMVCSGNSSTPVIFNSTLTGVVYEWTSGVSSPAVSGNILNGTGDLPPQTLINSGTTTEIVTFTITPSKDGCYGNAFTYQILVHPTPIVGLNAFPDLCVNSSVYTLTGGFPLNGVYSGNGVNSGYFNPSVAGVGIHTILYTYTDINGCSANSSTTIEVNPSPTVSLHAILNLCTDASPFTLTGGMPLGGSYLIDGTTSTVFNPQILGAGSHFVQYTYTDINGCANADSSTITINDLPIVTLNPFTGICMDASPFTLNGGNPINGIYSGTGVTDNEFNASSAGVGTHLITYTYTGGNGCTNNSSSNIIVNALPAVSFTGLDPMYCLNAPFVTLTSSPINGTYTGNGITGNVFTPAVAGTGNYTIVYSFTDQNNCSNSSSQTVIVDECLGLENVDSNNNFSIYPNPNNGSFVIETPSSDSYVMQIFNALGQKVIENSMSDKSYYNIDITNFGNGIYFVIIPKASFSKKIVVL